MRYVIGKKGHCQFDRRLGAAAQAEEVIDQMARAINRSYDLMERVHRTIEAIDMFLDPDIKDRRRRR